MTDRTWRPTGANVRASNPGNWSPGGAPAPGDTLQIGYLTTTINVRGHDLAGDPIRLDYSTLTMNLLSHAAAAVTMNVSNTATFNISGNSTLDLTTRSGAHVGNNTAAVNINGVGNFTLHNNCSQVTVNNGGRWNGTVQLGEWFGQGYGKTTVNGGTWNNNGASLVSNTENLVVSADVVGRGSFNVSNVGAVSYASYPTPTTAPLPSQIARMEFIGAVGSNQEVTDSGLLVLDRPRNFNGHITLTVHDAPIFPAEINLAGLAADSYNFQNDVLWLWSGKTLIDQLRLTDATPNGFTVQHTPTGVSVIATLDPAHAPIGLPLHV